MRANDVVRLLAVFIFLLGLPTLLHAAAYTVTQGGCGGAGSLHEAIDLANANPGADVVNFDPSVSSVQPSCPGGDVFPDSIMITESIEIIGPGPEKLNIKDNVQWITPSGNLNSALSCDSGNIIVAEGNTPFVVDGDGNPVVKISGLTFRNNFGVLETRKPATIHLENVVVRDTYAQKDSCQKPLISVSGELNMFARFIV